MPPERIGRFQVREVIGTGAFATVYRAADERFRLDVAVKVLAENHSFDASVRERFIDEGRRLRGFNSPHLIPVHDMGETDRAQPYLVMDWAEGGDLASRVAAKRATGQRPGLRDVGILARVVAGGLGVLHARQLVHRDLTPKNVLLRSVGPSDGAGLLAPEDLPVLADLGMSKDLAAASGLTLAAGTSGFAPPEQREPGRTVDRRADIWAASALVVWLVAGRPPEESGGWQAELAASGWPAGLVEALARGLAEQPEARFPTIEAWLGAVEEAVGDGAEPAPVESVPSRIGVPHAAQEAHPGHRRSRPSGRLAGVLLATLLVGALAGFVTGRDRSSGPSVRTEALDDDRVRTIVADHGVEIVLDGPAAAYVDETTELSATVEGSDSWTWVGPDGVLQADRPTLTLVPRTPGRGTVRVIAFTDQAQVVEAEVDLEILPRAG